MQNFIFLANNVSSKKSCQVPTYIIHRDIRRRGKVLRARWQVKSSKKTIISRKRGRNGALGRVVKGEIPPDTQKLARRLTVTSRILLFFPPLFYLSHFTHIFTFQLFLLRFRSFFKLRIHIYEHTAFTSRSFIYLFASLAFSVKNLLITSSWPFLHFNLVLLNTFL